MTGVFLQVRIDSTRLPKKALYTLQGKTVVEHAMDSLRLIDADVYALVTDEKSAAFLEPLATSYGFHTFPGHPSDVLKRYADAVRFFETDTFIRATGDNPLVSWELANSILNDHREKDADYSGYLGPPLGTGVEAVKSTALFTAEKESVSAYEREHVLPYLYKRPDRFCINRIYPGAEYILENARVTLDTRHDYLFLKRVYAHLYSGSPIPIRELVQWLKMHQKNKSNPVGVSH
jgi:spore coat polysaccharide biosynthesis protein SpsF